MRRVGIYVCYLCLSFGITHIQCLFRTLSYNLRSCCLYFNLIASVYLPRSPEILASLESMRFDSFDRFRGHISLNVLSEFWPWASQCDLHFVVDPLQFCLVFVLYVWTATTHSPCCEPRWRACSVLELGYRQRWSIYIFAATRTMIRPGPYQFFETIKTLRRYNEAYTSVSYVVFLNLFETFAQQANQFKERRQLARSSKLFFINLIYNWLQSRTRHSSPSIRSRSWRDETRCNETQRD